MFRYYLVFFCVFLARGVSSFNNPTIKIIDLYNSELVYFNDFLSSDNVENLQHSMKNIDYRQIARLRQASDSFDFLKGELIKWCSYANNVSKSGRKKKYENSHRSENHLINKTLLYLNEMKNKFIQISKQQQFNWDPNFETTIKMTNNVLKLEIIRGKLPTGVDWNHLFAEAKTKGYAEIIASSTTFDSNITQAMRIIENALNQINNYTSTYEDFDPYEMSPKCGPSIYSLQNTRTSYQITSFTPPSPSITKAMQDQLTEGENCASFWNIFSKKPICYAKLSKNTMTQIEKYYFNTSVISQFFEDIYVGKEHSDCPRHFLDFFENRYISWAYKSQNMASNQYLTITLCTKDKEVTFNII